MASYIWNFLAKNETKKNINADVNVPKSFLKNIFKIETIKRWNGEYLTTNKGDVTKNFFPTLFLKDLK